MTFPPSNPASEFISFEEQSWHRNLRARRSRVRAFLQKVRVGLTPRQRVSGREVRRSNRFLKGNHGTDNSRDKPPGLAEPAVGCECSPGPENGTAGAF